MQTNSYSMFLKMVGVLPSEDLPVAVRFWNGRRVGPPDAKVTITVLTPASITKLFPVTIGNLARAYAEGLVNIAGDIKDVVALATRMGKVSVTRKFPKLLNPIHTLRSDRAAVQFHYDVSNDFYRLWLDHNMVYSCGYFRDEHDSLDVAQEQKLEHICRKLNLQRGERLLDIGCGWGGLILWAAKHHGVHCVGVTLSERQHAYVTEKIRQLKLESLCEVRLMDYRQIDSEEHFDKIVSVGMFEHVGRKNLPAYFEKIYSLLKPGGLVLNHGISASWMKGSALSSDFSEFIDRYVFPDGELVHVAEAMNELCTHGLEIRDVESLRPHYAKTLWHWVDRLDRHADKARQLVGEKAYRVWRLYMAGSAFGFERGWISLYQILAGRPEEKGVLPLPLTREHIYRDLPDRQRALNLELVDAA